MAKDQALDFDLGSAHRHFAVACFNDCWELIDKPERTAEEEDEMLRRCFASAFHWSRRPDCSPLNRAVADWQLSRVLALVGDAPLAERYAQRSLDISLENALPPFQRGYAYEALARAAAVAKRSADVERYRALAADCAEEVEDADDRKLLCDDLAALR